MKLVLMLAVLVGGCAVDDFDVPDGAVRLDPTACCADFTGGTHSNGEWTLGTVEDGDLLVRIPEGKYSRFIFHVDGPPGDFVTMRSNAFTIAGEPEPFPVVVSHLPANTGWYSAPLPKRHGDTVFVLPESRRGTVRLSEMHVAE